MPDIALRDLTFRRDGNQIPHPAYLETWDSLHVQYSILLDLADTSSEPDNGLDQPEGRELVLILGLVKVALLRDVDASTTPVVL